MPKMREFILQNARVIDPAREIDKKMDIAVADGKISKPAALSEKAVEFDLSGLVISPGFIDMHVHLRQPGGNHKETIHTGTMAAAAGGFTTVVAMPNTNPPADNPGTIEHIRRHTETEGLVKVLPCGAMTKNLAGEEMAGIGTLKRAGVVAISDDGNCVHHHELMRHILEYAKSFNLPVLDHCQDENLSANGVMHQGYWSTVLGLRGIPPAAEELMVARDIILAELTGAHIHIQHISTAGAVRMLREAKRRKLPVSAEVTPHHISLDDELIKHFDTNFKVNPPIRSADHRRALIRALKDGIISVIATDHAPHTDTDKLVEFDYAPFGMIGLETAVPVCMTELVHAKVMDLASMIARFTTGPAEVLGLETNLAEGSPADITILDPEMKKTIDRNKMYSKSRNTPFHDYQAVGGIAATIVDGKFIFSRLPKVKGELSRL